MNDSRKEVKGFKAFNKDFKCLDFQYEVGKTYNYDGDIKICEKGFHFCENPLDIFNYYPPSSKFAQVTGLDEIESHNNDSKICSKSIKIETEISLKSAIEFGVKFIFEKIDWKNSIAATTGYGANAATTGDRANAATTGNETISAGLGINNKAKANLGSWLVLSEYLLSENKFKIKTIKTVKVDGVFIKANIYYKLENEEFVEWKD